MAEILDRGVHAGIARLTFGLSPAALAGAYLDWAAHLAFSPGKQAQLFGKALRKWARLGDYALGCCVSGGRGEPCIDPLPQDRRFSAEEWQGWPYNFLTRASFFSSNGGTTRQPTWTGSRDNTRTSSSSPPGRSST